MNYQRNPFVIEHQAKGVKNTLIPGFQNDQEVGSFLITDNQSNTNFWLGKLVKVNKLKIAFWLIILIFIVLAGRLLYLQLIQGKNYLALAEGNRIRKEYLISQRGIFFDRWHKPLVENISAFSLYLTPAVLINHSEEKIELRKFLISLSLADEKFTPDQIDQFLASDSQLPILIKENLSYNEAINLIIVSENHPSLDVIIDPRRNYLAKDFAGAHLLGYISRITPENKAEYLSKGYQLIERIGGSGLEKYYQDLLRGQPGEKLIEVDSLGREKRIIAQTESVPGKNIILGIDLELQNVIAETFKKYLPNQAAAAIALDPNNGKVRALLSWPTFDNNQFGYDLTTEEYSAIINNPLKPLLNRAISGEYPSGSTIKILISGAALEEGVVNRSTTVNSLGGVWYDKWFFPDWKAGGHGLTNIIKALAESVNTYFYYLALEDFDNHHGLGLTKLTNYFRIFGLGNILGIDLAGEKSGFIPTPEWKEHAKGEIWYPGDTLHLAIGQGDLLVTPLQIADLTGVVANGGLLYQPQLVEFVEDPVTGKREIIQPEILNSGMVSQENLKFVAEGMRQAVVGGSAQSLSGNPLEISGKTGTAQTSGNNKAHAWFTSFAPSQNPELVLTILVENGGEGSEIAVPIAKEIWQWYYENRYKK